MNTRKKAGLVTTGVVTVLVAASPLAFATDHGHDRKPHHPGGQVCGFEGGDGAAGSLVEGDSLINGVVQAPIAGNNIANIGNCSDFLNDNLNDNLSGNAIGVLSGPVVAAPGR